MKFYTRTIFLCLSVLSLYGCSQQDDVEALFADYLTRLHRVTETHTETFPIAPLSYPPRRTRRLPEPDIRIDVLDYFALRRCGLQTLIGQRNSGMGKVMTDTQRLIYEHEFLVTAMPCLAKLTADDAELREQLTAIIQLKRDIIHIAFWHATFGGQEFEKLAALKQTPLPLEFRAEIVQDIQAALDWLNTIQPKLGDDTLDLDSAQLEQHYQRLQQYPYLGKLLYTIALLERDLRRATNALQQRLDTRPVCFQNQPSQTGRILHNVFTKFYVGRIQPYLSQTYREGKAVLIALENMLETQQNLMPETFRSYAQHYLSVSHPDSAWQAFEQSIQAHTNAWQRLLTQCGMMPDGKNNQANAGASR